MSAYPIFRCHYVPYSFSVRNRNSSLPGEEVASIRLSELHDMVPFAFVLLMLAYKIRSVVVSSEPIRRRTRFSLRREYSHRLAKSHFAGKRVVYYSASHSESLFDFEGGRRISIVRASTCGINLAWKRVKSYDAEANSSSFYGTSRFCACVSFIAARRNALVSQSEFPRPPGGIPEPCHRVVFLFLSTSHWYRLGFSKCLFSNVGVL